MFIGREEELKFLEDRYNSADGQLVVLYGRRRVGKTELLRQFCQDKEHIFYTCTEIIDEKQLEAFSQRVLEKNKQAAKYITRFSDWEQALLSITELAKEKKIVVVIDEFPYMVKGNNAIPSILQKLWDEVLKQSNVMLILCGSAMSFIEKEVLAEKNPLYGRATGILKMQAMDFYSAQQFFPNYSIEDKITAYAILGGIPHYLKQFSDKYSLGENIVRSILSRGSVLYSEVEFLMRQELRETSVYNAVIEAVALGNTQLNDIYQKTQIDKSKLSVYLKNLMELELVEKVFSLDTPGRDNQRKAVYRISHPLVRFWFCFLYADSSLLLRMTPLAYYEQLVEPALTIYCESCFSKVCQEYMQRENARHSLPIEITEFGSFAGKAGSIDYIGHNESGRYIVAFADYRDPVFLYEKYLQAKALTGQAGIRPDYMYLFSGHSFDAKLEALEKELDTLILIRMDDL